MPPWAVVLRVRLVPVRQPVVRVPVRQPVVPVPVVLRLPAEPKPQVPPRNRAAEPAFARTTRILQGSLKPPQDI
jgi:hypothetical protein